ncbi:MAG: hypothetical protein JSR99_03185 [Proteobacteria bacterium]|nr:hypothetical protein [Pseudomonadota bacterium]
MLSEDATPVIFFVASLYFFAIVLLYVLARAWEQALSTRPETDKAPCPARIGPARFPDRMERLNSEFRDGNGGD